MTNQLWVRFLKLDERLSPVLRDEILNTPRIFRLVNLDFMSARQQLRRNATQKMSVAMIPIRDQRLIKQDYAHRANSSRLPIAFVARNSLYAAK